MTHDYKRNGATTLFAAMDVLEGSVIGRCMQRHTHQEFIRFLNAIEGFFAKLAKRRLRRGVFHSIVTLTGGAGGACVSHQIGQRACFKKG